MLFYPVARPDVTPSGAEDAGLSLLGQAGMVAVRVADLASPAGQPPSGAQAARSSGPAARWIAPSTPPPPSSDELAAFTTASTRSLVMSPWTASIRTATPVSDGGEQPARYRE